MSKEINKKWEKDDLQFKPITNASLVCKDCRFRYEDVLVRGNTSHCDKFEWKPLDVLNGGDCEAYKQE